MARTILRRYRGVRVGVSGGTDISGASNRSRGAAASGKLSILIQGPDIEQLQLYTTSLMEKVQSIKGVVDVDSNFEPTQPELRVTVDRVRAADLGVHLDSLATSLRTLIGGEEISEFKDGDDQFIVRLRLDEPFRNDPVKEWNAAAFLRRLTESKTPRPPDGSTRPCRSIPDSSISTRPPGRAGRDDTASKRDSDRRPPHGDSSRARE